MARFYLLLWIFDITIPSRLSTAATNCKFLDLQYLILIAFLLTIFPNSTNLALAWGIILITTPACHSSAGIAVNRFLPGALKATVNPGLVLTMSMWYTSAEQPLRLEAYYCTNGVGAMFGGLIGYVVGHITTSLARWKCVFIIFGMCSIAWGIVSLISNRAPRLAIHHQILERKRASCSRRSRSRKPARGKTRFKRYQAWRAVRGPKAWVLFIVAVGA